MPSPESGSSVLTPTPSGDGIPVTNGGRTSSSSSVAEGGPIRARQLTRDGGHSSPIQGTSERESGRERVGSQSTNWLWGSSRHADSSGSQRSQGGSGVLRRQSTSRSFADMVVPFSATPSDFRVDAKDPSIESLERWRRASLVRNALRRFRYVANLESRSQKFTPGQVGMALAAAGRFKLGLPEGGVDETVKAAQAEGFGLGATELERMVQGMDVQSLVAYGGQQGVALALGLEDTTQGIKGDAADIEKRARLYGTNTFPEKPEKSFFSFVWDAFQDFTLLILVACAIVSLLVGIATEGLAEGWTDGAGILMSVVLVVLVTATSDYRQAQQFILLDKEKKKVSIPVFRKGERSKISIYDLVVGDVVLLSIGDVIPADGVVLTASSLVVDESSMTGESHPVHKNTTDTPFLLAGTKVQDGTGTMLVTGVGMRTEWGHLMAKLSEEGEDETPLQVRLSGVATLVGRLGVYVALLVFIILMGRLGVSAFTTPMPWQTVLHRVVDGFAIAVTIVVVAVPEGLPLAVTLSLAFAMKKMMADKALVRKLAACETMGSATTICSDKTGTLTANQMTAVRAWLYNSVTDTHGSDVKLGVPQECQALLHEAIFTNTGGDVKRDNITDQITEIQGTPTESALLGLGLRMGGKFLEVREKSLAVRVDPFNSARKRMGVILRFGADANPTLPSPRSSSSTFAYGLTSAFGSSQKYRFRVHWKGAGEIIVGMCSNVVTPSGQVLPLNPKELEAVLEGFTSDALRTLGFAYCDLDPSQVPQSVLGGEMWPEDVPIPTEKLTLLALIGIQDPLRPSVPGAVALCKSAGIKVRMVTGDNLSTAKAIARGCGILTEGGVAVEGPEFRKMSPEEMRAMIPNLQVMARSSPSDKLTLVHELKAMGEVVAVTGDGTNDAPALKESDIGLAMGIAGTEVAKESADIIILDDNFASIVNVAKWGRSVYTNIQKFVQFQLTVNVVALTLNFISACATGDAPLNAVQLLWVNLIMDTLGALALATEPPTDDLMEKPPVGRHAVFITNIMWRNLLGQALFQLVLLLILPSLRDSLFGIGGDPQGTDRMNTIIFNTFVYCQVFNEINSREMEKINVFKDFFNNGIFLAIIGFTAAFQVVLVQYCGTLVGTVPLNMQQYVVCIAFGFLGMPIAALVKLIPVPAESWSQSLVKRFIKEKEALEEPLLADGNQQA